MQWCVGAPGLGRLNCCWVRTIDVHNIKNCVIFGESVRVSRGYKECVSPLSCLQAWCLWTRLVVMLVVRVVVCTCSDVGPAGLAWQIPTGMCSVWGQCQQGPSSLAALEPWLSACRLVLQVLPMVANSSEPSDKRLKGVRILPWGLQSPQLSAGVHPQL